MSRGEVEENTVMNRLKNRFRLPSLRSTLAVAGVAVVTLGISQTASTQAAFTNNATATVSTLATANYFPTPLTPAVNCYTDPDRWYDLTSNRANLSWTAVAGATGYYVRLVKRSNGALYREYNVPASQTSITGISTVSPSREAVYAYVHTKNGPAVSTGWTGANKTISYKDGVSNRTECESSASPSQANQPWENQTTWTPVTGAAGQASFKQSFGNPIGNTDGTGETPAAAPSATTTNPPTSTSAPTTSPTTSRPAPTTPDVTTTPPATTTSTTTPSATAPSETSQATTTTASTTSRPAVSPVDLGDGLTAKLVDRGGVRTVMIVSDGTEQCSAEVSHAEALDNGGNGKLIVTDSDGNVHYVDTSNCSIS